MAPFHTDYSDVLHGIDQHKLNSVSTLDCMLQMRAASFLKISALEGVQIAFEPLLTRNGGLPPPVLTGLMIRCLLPKGIQLQALRASLAGGAAGQLVRAILEGHRVTVMPEGGWGCLTRSAEQARGKLLTVLGNLPAVPQRVLRPVAPEAASLTSAALSADAVGHHAPRH